MIALLVALAVLAGMFLLYKLGKKNNALLAPPSVQSSKLVQWLAHDMRTRLGIDPDQDPILLKRLSDAAVACEEALRSSDTHTITLPFATVSDQGPVHYQLTMNREKFEAIVRNS
jgi:molecular chaperone DnaK (HSP70)